VRHSYTAQPVTSACGARNLLSRGAPRILSGDSSRGMDLHKNLHLPLWSGIREVLSPFTAWRLIKHRGVFLLSQRIMFRSVREPRTVSSHPTDLPIAVLPFHHALESDRSSCPDAKPRFAVTGFMWNSALLILRRSGPAMTPARLTRKSYLQNGWALQQRRALLLSLPALGPYPATGHLDTHILLVLLVSKQMPRRCPNSS
jgi:hypothetical protein